MMLIDKDSGKYEDHVNYAKYSFIGIKIKFRKIQIKYWYKIVFCKCAKSF